ARVHRTLRFERAVLRREVRAIRGIRATELRRDACSKVAPTRRRTDEDEIGVLRFLRDGAGPRHRRITVALDCDHLGVAEAARFRRDLERHAAQRASSALRDDDGLHRLIPFADRDLSGMSLRSTWTFTTHSTLDSVWSKFATCSATAFASPSSLKIFPPPRCGGSSIATTSIFGDDAVTPSAARSFSGISFFFAFMIPGRLGYRGSFALLCTSPTTGVGAVQTSCPPSISRQSSTPSATAAIFVSMPTCGQPSASASAGP